MGFQHDIFISYAHIDNQPLLQGERGWIDDLHSTLAVRAAQLAGQEVNIWRDPQLDGNDDFAQSITHQLPEAAVLVSVVTPRYVKSAWCKREFKAFCDACSRSGGVSIGDKTRIFKVVKTLVDLQDAPEEMRPFMASLLGYDFYTVDPQSGRIHEASPAHAKDLFLERLDDLAYDIAKLLKQMTEPEAANQETGKPVVYIAETSHDLQAQQAGLRRDLERRGYTVLPDQPVPLDADQLAEFVQTQLTRAALSVHMVGARYGVIPEGSTVSIVESQILQSQERAKQGNFVRLVWIPSPSPEIKDKLNQDLIGRLRLDGGWSDQADLLETSFESLKTAVDAQLQAIEKPLTDAPVVPSAAAAHEPVRVYFICDEADRQTAKPIDDLLFEQGCEVILPLFPSVESDPSKRQAEHLENLRTCDAAVIFYGAAGESFLRQALRELQDSGAGRKQPLRAKMICLAPPMTGSKQNFRTHEGMLIDLSKGCDLKTWTPFLDSLHAAS